eukprot:gnl/TRDRNA2_/TRDRNA2_202087_c0_seq1.p1 gnl/TRDRNA2_/TRDRNA2_202087_c0~~gnl/TRDRNA2_/TRDRNA2_202087_c0_seq1.p1  ORF type:complete len:407 (-),score=47.71 gnl/TRDRNA2_/TRDRNA2_202087_c0_seq1:33-1253(-)
MSMLVKHHSCGLAAMRSVVVCFVAGGHPKELMVHSGDQIHSSVHERDAQGWSMEACKCPHPRLKTLLNHDTDLDSTVLGKLGHQAVSLRNTFQLDTHKHLTTLGSKRFCASSQLLRCRVATRCREPWAVYQPSFHNHALLGRLSWIGYKAKFQRQTTTVMSALGPSADYAMVGSKWRIILDVGLEEGTWIASLFGSDWGASGARLLLPVDVEFVRESDGSQSLRPLRSAKFVSMQGEQTVRVEPGVWKFTSTDSRRFNLLFDLAFPDGAVKNDVALPADRVYFGLYAWDGTQLEQDKIELEKLQQEAQAIQDMDTSNSRQSSPRAPESILDQAREVGKLERMLAKARDLRRDMPIDTDDVIDGPGGLKIGKCGGLYVRRWKLFAGRVNYILGTFTIRPFDDGSSTR